jgi:hypothetical protein
VLGGRNPVVRIKGLGWVFFTYLWHLRVMWGLDTLQVSHRAMICIGGLKAHFQVSVTEASDIAEMIAAGR